jgi:hypothetical protein
MTRVKVEILSDASKQMKLVTMSLNEPDFDKTLDSAPTVRVDIIDLEEIDFTSPPRGFGNTGQSFLLCEQINER